MLDSFLDKLIVLEDGCWEWSHSRNSEGYGNIWVDKKCKKAHRVSYELHFGPIPEGLLVCHHCDNPPCCNPDHLFLGTDADNTQDKVNKGRMVDNTGTNNPSAVLIEREIRQIHDLVLYSPLTQEEIAASYFVSKGHINNIKAGRCWANIYKEIYENE